MHAARLLEHVQGRIERAVDEHQRGGHHRELDVAAVHRAAYAELGHPLDARQLDEVAAIEQRAWWAGVTVAPGALAMLQSLRRRGLRVGVCSNAPYRPASMRAQLDHLGLLEHLDSVTFSAEVGWRKPSRRLFEAALQALGTAAPRTVMVGDSMREDIAGAHAAGLVPVRTRQFRDDSRPGPAHAVIGNLDEVVAALEGIGRSTRPYTDLPGCAVGGDGVDFRDYLKQRCRDRGISLHRLALLCDLNQIYFYQAVNKNRDNPPPWVLRRAAPHLGVGYVDLLLAAGYLTEDDLREWRDQPR